MADYEYIRTGTQPDREPACTPYARGLYVITKRNARHEKVTEEDYIKINLHAQKELSALSPVFAQAQAFWSRLPHTQDRQMDNLCSKAARISSDNPNVKNWIGSFASRPGLVYIFSIEREIDLDTGGTFKPIPVVGITFGQGFSYISDRFDEQYLKYRMYFAYAEK